MKMRRRKNKENVEAEAERLDKTKSKVVCKK